MTAPAYELPGLAFYLDNTPGLESALKNIPYFRLNSGDRLGIALDLPQEIQGDQIETTINDVLIPHIRQICGDGLVIKRNTEERPLSEFNGVGWTAWKITAEQLTDLVKQKIGVKPLPEKPRIYPLKEVLIKEPLFYVEHSFNESPVLDFSLGNYYALAEIKDLRKKILIRSKTPYAPNFAKLCLKPLSEDEISQITIPRERVKEFMHVSDNSDAMQELRKEHSSRRPHVFYEETLRLNDAYLQKIKSKNEEWFDELIEKHLYNGWEYDTPIKKWIQSLAIALTDSAEDYKLMKYRGHATIIKNSSSGVTTAGGRLGTSFAHSTQASLRGFSKGDGTSNPSLLHNQHGSVLIDEFVNQPAVGQAIMNYLQNGVMKTASGAVELESKATAKITFAGNFPKDAESPEDMVFQVEAALNKVSSAGNIGTGARIGFNLWNNGLIPAKQRRFISDEEEAQAEAVFSDVRKHITPKIRLLYHDSSIREWLEEADKEYKDAVEGLAAQIIPVCGSGLKSFIKNHGNAIRHIKGFALEVVLCRHIRSLLLDEYTIDKILLDAKEEYEEIKTINLNSFTLCVGWFSVLDVEKYLTRRFNSLTDYEKAVVLGLHYGLKTGDIGEGQIIRCEELAVYFERTPETIKEKLGRCDTWSYVVSKLPKKRPDKMVNCLRHNFDVEVILEENNFSFRVRDKDLILRLNPEKINEESGIIGTTGTTGIKGIIGIEKEEKNKQNPKSIPEIPESPIFGEGGDTKNPFNDNVREFSRWIDSHLKKNKKITDSEAEQIGITFNLLSYQVKEVLAQKKLNQISSGVYCLPAAAGGVV